VRLGKGQRQVAGAALLLMCVAGLFPAQAEPSKKEAASNLAKIEQKMEESKAVAATLEEKKKATSSELKNLQSKMIVATEALAEKQDRQDELEERLETLEKEADTRNDERMQAEERYRDLTGLLLNLSRLPPSLYLFKVEPWEDQFHRALLLRSMIGPLRAESAGIEQSLERLESSRRKLAEERRLVAQARQNLVWQRANLNKLVRMRQGFLQKTEADKAAITSQLTALADEAKDLRQLIDKLTKKSSFTREGAAVLKGFKMPTGGKVVRSFGARDADGVASQGLTIAGAPEAPIVAPQEGRIVFAGPFRGYGKIVIIDHGGGRHSFLAGFGRIDADVEEVVAAGEPLGSLPSGKDSARPELYYEARLHGEPVNPGGKR